VITEGPERIARAIFTAFSMSSSEEETGISSGNAIAALL
jgi:hypothetical protein